MFKITATTVKMFARRGVAVTTYTEWNSRTESEIAMVEFAKLEDLGAGELEPADEFAACYRHDADGLFFVGSCKSDSEEWPNWISSEQQLRSLADAIAQEV